jgi:hypothetical protein
MKPVHIIALMAGDVTPVMHPVNKESSPGKEARPPPPKTPPPKTLKDTPVCLSGVFSGKFRFLRK